MTFTKLTKATAYAVVVAIIATVLFTAQTNTQAQGDPDATRAGATDLGDITGQSRAKGGNHAIDGVDDQVDYFTFSLTATREVMVKLKEMERNADLFLEDQDGNEIARSDESGTANETIVQELDAGTYYIKVEALQRGSNVYKLRYKATEQVPDNIAATGAPTITGTAEVGETLTAGRSAISDENGLANVQFTYQWIRNDGANDTEISGATGASYWLTVDDLNHTIKVQVNFTDDNGYDETATSSATDPVNRPPNALPTGRPTITGTPAVDEVLSVDPSAIADANGLTSPGFTYQWLNDDGTTDSAIAGAASSTHTVTNSDTGNALKVSVSFTDDHGYAHTLTSDATDTVPAVSDATDPVLVTSQQHNDECPEDRTTTCTIELEGSFDGNIHNPNNREYEEDWIKLENVTTGLYRFTLKGRGPDRSDSLTMIIRKGNQSQGTVASGTHNYTLVSGNFAGARGPSTDVYIEVRGENGDYQLSVNRLSYTEPAGADLDTGINTAGWLNVGDDPYPRKSGNVAPLNDEDSFHVDLEAGKSYRIDVKGNERADYGGTAPDTIMSLIMPTPTSATLLNPIQDVVFHISAGGALSEGMIAFSGGQGANARLEIAVNTSGQFKIAASDANSTGTYTVTVKDLTFTARGSRPTISEAPGSDVGGTNLNTAGHVQVNGAGATGNLPSLSDGDGFLVHLEANRAYQIDVWGNAANDNGGTLSNPAVDLLFPENVVSRIKDPSVIEHLNPAVSGQSAVGIFNDDGGEGDNARLNVKVHKGGTYLIHISAASSTASGTYTVFVRDDGNTFTAAPRGSKQSVSEGGQDLPNFLTSDGYVQVNGDGATGNIANATDEDVFAVKLNGHTQYRIEVWGDNANDNGGSLADPKLTIRNPAFDRTRNPGELEQLGIEPWTQFPRGGVQDNNSGSGNNAQVDVAPNWPGRTFYIQVSGHGGSTGTYTVFVTEIGKDRRIAPTPAVMFLPPGHSYWPTVSEPPGGNFPENASTKGWVKPDGSRAHGNMWQPYDQDAFKVKLVRRYSYRIDVKGDNSSEPGGTLRDPEVILQDADVNDIFVGDKKVVPDFEVPQGLNPRIHNFDSGAGQNARLGINVFETGTYHLMVSDEGADTGTYTVQVTLLGPTAHLFPPQGDQRTVSEPAGEDLSDSRTETDGRIQPDGDPATGEIGVNGDQDAFTFELLQNASYRIDVEGATLADPEVLLIGPSGVTITEALNFIDLTTGRYTSEGVVDDNSGQGNNARLEFKNILSGTSTYTIKVREKGDDATGTYTVTLVRTG